jgi:hypothetical protein
MPVKEWLLNDLSKEERKSVGEKIKLVELGWPLGVPLVRKFDEGIGKEGVMSKKHIGESFDTFLKEEGIYEEVVDEAVKKVLAFQIREVMKKNHLTKSAMAKKMETSRAALDRLLEPDNDAVTLKTLKRAAAVIGKKIKLELV